MSDFKDTKFDFSWGSAPDSDLQHSPRPLLDLKGPLRGKEGRGRDAEREAKGWEGRNRGDEGRERNSTTELALVLEEEEEEECGSRCIACHQDATKSFSERSRAVCETLSSWDTSSFLVTVSHTVWNSNLTLTNKQPQHCYVSYYPYSISN